MGIFNDLTGKRFGRLTVLRHEYRLIGKRKRIYWKCRCDCGKDTYVEASNLTTGHARSCKCLQKESRHEHTRTHGKSNTKTYRIWKGMIRRCSNSNRKDFHNYGGRGITVCKSWLNFSNFISDMGECPKNHSIDRKDNSIGYSKNNCRWSTTITQANNKRTNAVVFYKGTKFTISELSRKYNVPYHRLWQRIKRLGWSIDDAVKST